MKNYILKLTISILTSRRFVYTVLGVFFYICFNHYALAPVARLVLRFDSLFFVYAADEELHFSGSLPAMFIKLPAPQNKKDPQVMLANACDGDAKCVCVNNAIFKHDSSWATAGVGARANNPCNMRVPSTWEPSVPMSSLKTVSGKFAKFNTLADGVTACVELWARNYKELPAAKLVSRWTNGGGNRDYRAAVAACYV